MARAYTAQANNVSVSAVIDLLSLQTTGAMVMEIDELDLGQVTATSVGNLRCQFKRFSGGYTIGSGGTPGPITPRPHVFGDSAATVTAHGGDTTPTSGGTPVTLGADAINVINGYQKLPAPEDRWSFTISQAFVWTLDSAPGSAETMSMQVVFRETV
jgi:hypothetical protein